MPQCNQCGKCCSRIEFWFNIPTGADQDIPIMREFYEARGWGFDVVGKEFCVSKPDRCPHLAEDNLCDIYSSRPHVCRAWGESIKPHHNKDCAYYR